MTRAHYRGEVYTVLSSGAGSLVGDFHCFTTIPNQIPNLPIYIYCVCIIHLNNHPNNHLLKYQVATSD